MAFIPDQQGFIPDNITTNVTAKGFIPDPPKEGFIPDKPRDPLKMLRFLLPELYAYQQFESLRHEYVVAPLTKMVEQVIPPEFSGEALRKLAAQASPITQLIDLLGKPKQDQGAINRAIGSFATESVVSLLTDPLVYAFIGESFAVKKLGKIAVEQTRKAAIKELSNPKRLAQLSPRQIHELFVKIPTNVKKELFAANPKLREILVNVSRGIESRPPSAIHNLAPVRDTPQSLLPFDGIGFEKVSKEFLLQPKKKVGIIGKLFRPSEFELKRLGFEENIAQPIRESMQRFNIELSNRKTFVGQTRKLRLAQTSLPKDKSDLAVWNMMDKGIPKGDISIEAETAKKYRTQTEQMLTRINEVKKQIGEPEVQGVKNYIFHSVTPEILGAIYDKGVIPAELAKIMDNIPPTDVFLRTALERHDIPDEWLTKDPDKLMETMYAIDLRYIHLGKALDEAKPYISAVKDFKGTDLVQAWDASTYKYLEKWVERGIKRRPSSLDNYIDNTLEGILRPLFKSTGLRVTNMPWETITKLLSASVHTGALGMRIKPVLRNLVQSTFDWVMWGTKAYLKGSKVFMTKEGQDILKQSLVWQTRVPFEGLDINALQKVFRAGSVPYRLADLHNVGKSILTTYFYGKDTLKMPASEALRWADQQVPRTQWSYSRIDLPPVYQTSTGRAFWTLGSWWMNYYFNFLPELATKAFTGKDVLGRKVPTVERLGIVRLFVLTGILWGVKIASGKLTGTVVDYTGSIAPSLFRQSPFGQLLASTIKFTGGMIDKDPRRTGEGLREMVKTAPIFIPFYLGTKDLFDVISGRKTLGEISFPGKRKKVKRTLIKIKTTLRK